MSDFDGEILGSNPIQIPQIYEQIIASGELSPGVCELSGFERTWEWQKNKAKGASGATTTLQGEPLAEGTIKFMLWLPQHFAEWEAFREVLVRGLRQKKIEALDVLHPYLQLQEIFSLVVEKIGIPVRERGGLYTVSVSFSEYRPPKAAGGTTAGSKGWTSKKQPGGKDPPTAQSEQDKEIQKLLDEAQQP